ncbi:MAG: hotdog fold thioesterase [Pseudomonadota bacterium]
MSIWRIRPTIDGLQAMHADTAIDALGVEFTDIGDDCLSARMPVDRRTRQPYGVLHGGTSVVLAETLGSCGAFCVIDDRVSRAFGQEINANHIRPVTTGWVTGTARPVHLGRSSHVWSIEIVNDDAKLVCVARLTVAVIPKADEW